MRPATPSKARQALPLLNPAIPAKAADSRSDNQPHRRLPRWQKTWLRQPRSSLQRQVTASAGCDRRYAFRNAYTASALAVARQCNRGLPVVWELYCRCIPYWQRWALAAFSARTPLAETLCTTLASRRFHNPALSVVLQLLHTVWAGGLNSNLRCLAKHELPAIMVSVGNVACSLNKQRRSGERELTEEEARRYHNSVYRSLGEASPLRTSARSIASVRCLHAEEFGS